MANLTVDSLSRITQSGDIEKLFSGSTSGSVKGGMGGVGGVEGTSEAGQISSDSSKTFSKILEDSVEKANLHQTEADSAIKELVAGRNKNIHETLLAVERADASLKMMMQVRNKIIDAYKEVMRMQI